MRDPRPDELELPEFEKVWQAIKGWDIERTPNAGCCEATGTDVITILDALGITREKMTCEDKLKKLIAACDKELSTDPASGKQWREDKWGVFMDEAESWENIRKGRFEGRKMTEKSSRKKLEVLADKIFQINPDDLTIIELYDWKGFLEAILCGVNEEIFTYRLDGASAWQEAAK